MFHRLLGDDSRGVLQTAERMSEYILRTLGEFQEDKHASHRHAILVTHLSCRLLQLSYAGPDMTTEISAEVDRLLAAVAGNEGEA